MKISRIIPTAALSSLVVIALAGCLPFPTAVTPASPDPTGAAPAPSETSVVPEAPVETPAPPVETPVAPAPSDGAVAAPGTKVGANVPQVYEFTGTDDQKALISAQLLDVTPATAEQTTALNELSDDLQGYDLWLIHFEETKVSGDAVEFNSDYSYFKPADASGEAVGQLTIISGFEECATESFTEEFDAGTPLKQCIVAYAPSGGKAPAGMLYKGGYEDDNPYDTFDGQPLLFIIE